MHNTTRLRAHQYGIIAFASIALVALAGCGDVQSSAASPSSAPASDAPSVSLSLEQRMIDAIETGDVAAAQAVLEEGLSPDAPLGGTAADPFMPLHRAAGADQAGIVSLLIEAGATVDATTGGLTPLMLASSSGSVDTIQALLDGGADPTLPNFKYYGLSAWHYAARDGNIPALQTFLDWGVDVDYQDTTYGTAVSWAAGSGQAEAVEFLIAAGADLNLRDTTTTTPLGWAIAGGFTEVAEMLEAAGGVL